MSRRIGIIAAGGESRRTGLGDYTSKAALSMRGKPLIAHQLDFLRRSGCVTAFVVVRPQHVRLLGELLSSEDRLFAAFVLCDRTAGWADTLSCALKFVRGDDEVVLISCDNDHAGAVAPRLEGRQTIMTYTTWTHKDRWPTNGPVFARDGSVWIERSGAHFVGDFFSGFVVVRGNHLVHELSNLEAVNGKREFTSLLMRLCYAGSVPRPSFFAIPYPGVYEDVSDLRALALLDAEHTTLSDRPVGFGAGVLLHDLYGNVLLTLRQDGLGWTIPGGGVDAGETFAQTAVREAWEEIGVRLSENELRLLGVYPCIGKDGNPACSIIFHAVSAVEERDTQSSPTEVLEVGKFNKQGVSKLTIPFGLRRAVDDWFAGRELDVR